MKTALAPSSLVLCLALVGHAVAGFSLLDEPGFGFPDTFPAASRQKVSETLRRTDCKFLGGTSFTAGTVLRYEGETVPLNLFLEDLAACPGITLSIRFNNPENANYDWTVEQDGFQPERLCVRINWKSPRLKIENFVAPDWTGPAAPPTK
jgi:hypothetical protein